MSSHDHVTARDWVWAAATKQAIEDGVVTATTAHERLKRKLDEPPTKATVRNVLHAMDEIGYLSEKSGFREHTNVYTLSEVGQQWFAAADP